MRLIIQPDYVGISQWAADYVVQKINAAAPTAAKPFVLGLPTGSSPLGMYRAWWLLIRPGAYPSSTSSPSTWTST